MLLEVEMELDQQEPPQVVPGEQHEEYPGQAADHIIDRELFPVHGNDARDDRREGSDDRQEAGEKNGLSAMQLIELLRLVQVFFLEEKIILPVEEVGAALMTEPIAQRIADDAANRYHDEQDQQVQDGDARPSRRQTGHQLFAIDACYEKQAVPGEEETDHQACLREYDK